MSIEDGGSPGSEFGVQGKNAGRKHTAELSYALKHLLTATTRGVDSCAGSSIVILQNEPVFLAKLDELIDNNGDGVKNVPLETGASAHE